MSKTTKIIILGVIVSILILGIGYAAIQNITLNITGTAAADPSQSNFKVMFTGTPDISDSTLASAAITDDTNATINVNGLKAKGDSVSVIYTVENNSTDLSADVSVNATNSNTEYFTITSRVGKTSLLSGETTTVTVDVELKKTPLAGTVTSAIGVQLETIPVQPGEEGSSGLTNDFSQTTNEYGFYFDKPYSSVQDEKKISVIFYADGSADIFEDGRPLNESASAGYFLYEYKKIYNLESEDEILMSEDGLEFSTDNIKWWLDTTLKKIPNDVYFDNDNDGNDYIYKYFPIELKDGDCYIYEDYLYEYISNENGWKVFICNEIENDQINIPYSISKDKTSYSPILDNILGKPVVDLCGTFDGCKNLIEAPIIPNTITKMRATFFGCTSLEIAPIIPESVTTLSETFYRCSSLKEVPALHDGIVDLDCTFVDCVSLETAPIIPNNVENMGFAFSGCTSLKKVPVIPEKVTRINDAFYNCTSLEGIAEININQLISGGNCFYNVDMSKITLTGTASKIIINYLGSSGLNYIAIP